MVLKMAFLLPSPGLAHALGLMGQHDLHVPSLIARCHREGLAGKKQGGVVERGEVGLVFL